MSRSITPAVTGLHSPADVSPMVSNSQRGSGCEVLPRHPHPIPRRRLRIQPEVAEDLVDDRPLEEGRNDRRPATAAVRVVLNVYIEHAPGQACKHRHLNRPRPVFRQYPLLAGCRYRREAASWQSSLDKKICPRVMTLARM